MYDWLCLQKAGALRAAAMVRDVALTEMLLTAGADPNSQNPKVCDSAALPACYIRTSQRQTGSRWLLLGVT